MTEPTDTRAGAKLRIERSGGGGVLCLKLIGTIDEEFDGKKVAAGIEGGALVLDLGEIERISSFGIREWVDFVTGVGARVASLWFIECAPKVIDQLNMVGNFGGAGHVLSFYAPYRCDYCDDDRRRLVKISGDGGPRSTTVSERACESCGNPEYFDEDPLTFFAYLEAHPPPSPPPNVATFLAARRSADGDAGARKLKIEKQIDGRATYVKLTGDLDAAFPRDKLADGLEGDVLFDLAGVGKIDPAGAAEWRRLMAQIAPATERLILSVCPTTFVERLTGSADLVGKAVVASFSMPYSCASCQKTQAREIDVAKSWELIKFATAPELECPDCGGPTSCTASETLLAHLPALPRPALDDELRAQLERLRQEAARRALAAKGPPSTAAPFRQAAPATLARVSRSRAVLIVASLAVVGFAAGAWFARGWFTRGAGDTPATGEGALMEASAPLRPAWLDQTFTREAERLLFVGRATAADRRNAAAEAETGALEEIAHQLDLASNDALFVEHVRAQFEAFRAKALADLARAELSGDPAEVERAAHVVQLGRARVAESLRKTEGALAAAEPRELYWEKRRSAAGPRYTVYLRQSIARANFARWQGAYQTGENALGMRALTYFPELAWRYEMTEGAVVAAVATNSPLRLAGLQEGDLVISVMDRIVHHAASLRRELEEESARLEHADGGGLLVLKIKRGEAPAVDLRVRIAGVAAPPAREGSAGKPKKTKNQTGNIWDDNPDE